MGWNPFRGAAATVTNAIGSNPGATLLKDVPAATQVLGINDSKLGNLENIAKTSVTDALNNPTIENVLPVIDPAMANLYGAISGNSNFASIGAQGIAQNTGNDPQAVLDVGAVVIGSYMLGVTDPDTLAALGGAAAGGPTGPAVPEVPAEAVTPPSPIPEGPINPDLSELIIGNLGKKRGRRSTNLTGGQQGAPLGGVIGYPTLLGS